MPLFLHYIRYIPPKMLSAEFHFVTAANVRRLCRRAAVHIDAPTRQLENFAERVIIS